MIHKDFRYRLHQRERVIRKRLHIIRNAWGYGDDRPFILTEQPGRLDKYNLNCGCPMCQANKISRPEDRFDWRTGDMI